MLMIFRVANLLYRWRIPFLPRLLYLLNRVVFAIALPPSVEVGKEVLFGYSGLGIVVHSQCKIGSRVQIGTGVTIGGRGGLSGVPRIEDDVLIGTGAKILGPITVGRGARIGANAVVLGDVAPETTVVGLPARPVAERRNATEEQ